MTGIQALERAGPTKLVQPELVERREIEYIRHGRVSLIANFDVVRGQLSGFSLGPTGREVDFAAPIEARVKSLNIAADSKVNCNLTHLCIRVR